MANIQSYLSKGKEPLRYAAGIISLLYLGGCRCVNSYFTADFASFASGIPERYRGYMSREQAVWINEYAGRLGTMLDGASDCCGTFLYYAIEDAQAKTRPSHCAAESADLDTDRSLLSLSKRLSSAGHCYQFADREDLVNAAEEVKKASGGQVKISGIPVKYMIMPAMDVIWPDAWEALEIFAENGVKVMFADRIPGERVGERKGFVPYDFREESIRRPGRREAGSFRASMEEEILRKLENAEGELVLSIREGGKECGEEQHLLQARYQKDGADIFFLVNPHEETFVFSWSRGGFGAAEGSVTSEYKEHIPGTAEIWDPQDGSVKESQENGTIRIGSCRGLFLVFRRTQRRKSSRE